jgi:hypothetical protein
MTDVDHSRAATGIQILLAMVVVHVHALRPLDYWMVMSHLAVEDVPFRVFDHLIMPLPKSHLASRR